MTGKEFIGIIHENKLFDDEDFVDSNIHNIIDFQSKIVNGNNMEDLIYLMYGLDDNSMRFDITQALYEGITSFYFKNPKTFFLVFLKNIGILYPHAIEISKYILKPVLNIKKSKEIICEQLNFLDEKECLIFREIYEQIVKENNIYFDDCINEKLALIS